jgi:hypothetical protein
MWILDAAGTVLPEGIRFFTIGWWVIHALGVALVYAWGYRKGRKDERRNPEPLPERGGPQRTSETRGRSHPEGASEASGSDGGRSEPR